jgi:hypothetical protein
MDSERPVHAQVLEAARRIADGAGTFRLRDLVAALPHLNPGTVRTHVASRCCISAPAHHQTRWPYFHVVRRGIYRIDSRVRRAAARRQRRGWQDRILESGDTGIDPTLIAANLRLTPTERLEQLRAFLAFIDDVRQANGPGLQAPVRFPR